MPSATLSRSAYTRDALCTSAVAFAFALAVALPAAGAAPADTPARARADDLALARQLLLNAWEGSGKDDWLRARILPVLAVADLERAEALLKTLPAEQQPLANRAMGIALLDADRERGLARTTAGETDPRVLLHAAGILGKEDPAAARAMLDRALAASAVEAEKGDVCAAAALARRLGHPRAAGLRAEAVRHTQEHLARLAPDDPQRNGRIYDLASSVAPVDLDQALKLADAVSAGDYRRSAKLRAIGEAAELDPKRCLALLEEVGWSPEGHPDAMLGAGVDAARAVAVALAPQDLPTAVSLIRRLPFPNDRAQALAAVAQVVPAEQAAALRRQARTTLRNLSPWDWNVRCSEILLFFPPGSDRAYACALALAGAGVGKPGRRWRDGNRESIRQVATVAFHLAAHDPNSSRTLLEQALTFGERADPARRLEEDPPRPEWVVVPDDIPITPLYDLAVAYAAVDPERAATLAAEIPAEADQERYEAQFRIARYLGRHARGARSDAAVVGACCVLRVVSLG